MEYWQHIVNTSMIGTDKKTISSTGLPSALQNAAQIIFSNESSEKEDKFLQIASLALGFRQSGLLPLKKEQATIVVAGAEEKPYCSKMAVQVLKDILQEESIPLLKFWLLHCTNKHQIVLPDLIADLMEIATAQKSLQSLIAGCCGKRGEWLSQFNTALHFSAPLPPEELWQTGTPEQRKKLLKETRATDPATARAWVQQVWPQEDAATKNSFLQVLENNISPDDIAFLETISADKGKKIKETALELLKQIPGSPIVLQYQQILEQAVFLKKEKALLGLTTKTTLQFSLPGSIDESVFKSGIEKLSNSKEFTDDTFIISQLMRSVPLSFWEAHLQLKPEEIIQVFQKDATGKKMIPSLVTAITKFRDTRWAVVMMQYSEVFYIDIIPLLPLELQDLYSSKFFGQFPDQIITYATNRETEWNTELALLILGHTAKNSYQYNRSFYNQHIHLLPGKAALSLEKLSPAEDYLKSTWSNTSDYILKLLSLKAQTIQSFN
ncbi:MAG: DUF5691 domain-containing protein [Ferruginibacter sp.]